jgi:cell division septation protein DedD
MPASKDSAGSGRSDGKTGAQSKEATAARMARRHRRLSGNTGGGRLSRPLAAALIVIVAGGAYLFWPRGGGVPVGIGEQLTVITADSIVATAPRSGSVEIAEELQPLVAERPAGQPATATDAPAKPAAGETKTQPTSTAKPKSAPAAQPPAAASASTATTTNLLPGTGTARIQPRQTGGWAVQVGAYGQEANADRLASQLKDKGFDAQVRAASTATGDLIYRVWIGWFPSRDQALAYARQERSLLGEAHPVHR